MHPVSPVIPTVELDEIKIAEHQPEYQMLPAVHCGEGVILTRWKLLPEEIEIVRETGDVYLYMHTFGKPVTPIMLQVERPEMGDVLDAEIVGE